MNRVSRIDRAALADARPRLAAFVVFVAAVTFVLSSIPSMLAALALVLVATAAVPAGASSLLLHARRLWPFCALIVLINGWAVPGEAVLEVAGRTVSSREGLVAGAFFCLRLIALYLAMFLIVKSTRPEELAAAFHATLRRVSPAVARRAAFYGFVAMSFVPLFADELRRVRIAQSFRGGDLTGSLSARVRSARLLVVPLILSAVHRSAQLAVVTELRGLKDRLESVLVVRPPRLRDTAVVIATLAVVTAAAVFLQ